MRTPVHLAWQRSLKWLGRVTSRADVWTLEQRQALQTLRDQMRWELREAQRERRLRREPRP